ncbi:doublecortin domain-containing protein [Cavenderia fasciculata]|uniref:Doublecortin domain-containing protein n=1 Tax=Cavenderia fasciculata TaxID=261658 RepID=F4PLG5_CACFS|nr:doublecortin domain-containing protein [Cavenderia fasciculata]EGG23387.1 doublecortin domain-containing protein [Cavenderia fasciculata]|eukprot:XP_004361238.1 doublecortin domain-containing protein [Cavenderia fasciculata]
MTSTTSSITSPTRTGMQKFGLQTEKGKVLHVWRNADRYQEEGVRIVVHPTKFKTYDQLKTELNAKIKLVTGSVQKLYGMDKKLVKGLDDLVDGENYIVCAAEKLDESIVAKGLVGLFGGGASKGGEQASTSSAPSGHEETSTSSTAPPAAASPKKAPVSSVTSPPSGPKRFESFEKSKVIWAFRNTDDNHKGERITVHPSKYKTYDQLKEELSKQVRLVNGAVRKVYNRQGVLVKGLEDIEDGGNYLCCAGEALDLTKHYKFHE